MSRHTIRHLIRASKDATRGYATAAACAHDGDLSSLFHGISRQRERFIRALELAACAHRETSHASGSGCALLHRAWMTLRCVLAADRSGVLLRSCRWADGTVCVVYRDVLRRGRFDADTRKMIALQLEVIESGRRRLLALAEQRVREEIRARA